jgi:hypothetical protein
MSLVYHSFVSLCLKTHHNCKKKHLLCIAQSDAHFTLGHRVQAIKREVRRLQEKTRVDLALGCEVEKEKENTHTDAIG